MSKKIKIPLDNMRHALHDLFHEHLDEIYELSKINRGRRSRYDWAEDDEVQWLMQQGVIFPGMEDELANFYGDEDDDDFDNVWPPTSTSHEKRKGRVLDPYGNYWDTLESMREKKGKKKHKRGSRGKSKARVIDINVPYSGEETDPTELDYDAIDTSGIEDGKVIWFYPDYRNKSDRLEFNTLSSFSDFCSEEGYHVPSDVGMDIAYRRMSHTCLDPQLREEGIFQIIADESYADMMYNACPVQELSQ